MIAPVARIHWSALEAMSAMDMRFPRISMEQAASSRSNLVCVSAPGQRAAALALSRTVGLVGGGGAPDRCARHPIGMQCTPSVRVLCDLTGALRPNGCFAT